MLWNCHAECLHSQLDFRIMYPNRPGRCSDCWGLKLSISEILNVIYTMYICTIETYSHTYYYYSKISYITILSLNLSDDKTIMFPTSPSCKSTLPFLPIVMVQWKADVSPIVETPFAKNTIPHRTMIIGGKRILSYLIPWVVPHPNNRWQTKTLGLESPNLKMLDPGIKVVTHHLWVSGDIITPRPSMTQNAPSTSDLPFRW